MIKAIPHDKHQTENLVKRGFEGPYILDNIQWQEKKQLLSRNDPISFAHFAWQTFPIPHLFQTA